MTKPHIQNPDGVVIDLCSRGAKEHNPAVRGVLNHVISHSAVLTADADSVSPFLECIAPAGTDVVVLDGNVGAAEVSFGNVQTRPASRVIRSDKFNELVGVRATHLDVASA